MVVHRHGRDTSVPEKEQSEIHTHGRVHTEQSPVLQRGGKLPLVTEDLKEMALCFPQQKKMCINKDPVFLAAVSWTEIDLNVGHSRGPAHPEPVRHSAQVVTTWVWSPTSPEHIGIYVCAMGKSMDS